MRSITEKLGCGLFICGFMGVAGAIELGKNPTVALIMTALGIFLVLKGDTHEKDTSNSSESDFRVDYLPKR